MKECRKLLCKIKSYSAKRFFSELKWIYRYSSHYKIEVLWYIFLGALGTVIGLVGSILSKYIIDIVTDYDSGGIVIALSFFVLMQILKIAINAVSSRVNTKINIKVNQQITSDIYNKIMNTDWESMTRYHSGDLLSRVVGDVSTISSSVLGWIPSLITRLLQFVATLAVILYYDSTLAVLALISAPVTIIMSRFVLRKMRDHNEKMRQLSSEMMIFNEESFQNIQIIKGFDLADYYSNKHHIIQENYKDVSLKYNSFAIQKNSIMSLVGTIVAIVCFGWSIHRLNSGFITYGTMTLFLQLSSNLSEAFSALAAMIPSAVNASTAAGRIMDIINLPKEDRSDAENVKRFVEKQDISKLSVEAKGLSYEYEDGRSVLSDANFSADAGQVVAFIGPSGEGKTTLLRLLLGIVSPHSGSLIVRADSGEKVSVSASTRGLFAYVPQGNTLFSGTVAENMRMVKSDATDQEIWNVLETACADDFIQAMPLGINTHIKEQGGGFSQGQLQRLCIARALLTDAPILLMDEATSALDIETERKVLKNIMSTKHNRTCIITTHRLSVLDISDRIYSVSHDSMEELKREDINR